MTLKLRAKRRTKSDCPHPAVVETEIAGMVRTVCESCNHVGLEHASDHITALRSQTAEAGSPSTG